MGWEQGGNHIITYIRSEQCYHLAKHNSWFQTFAVFWILYAFFWVIPRRLNFIWRRFGTLCLFHLHRRIGVKWHSTPIRLWRWNRQSVPKRRHIKFRRRGITQKKAYNEIQLFARRELFRFTSQISMFCWY